MLYLVKKIYRDSMFCPGWLGIVFNPFFLARRNLCLAMVEFSSELTGSLLDVGCGTKPYRHIFRVTSYTGLDIDTPVVRRIGVADDLYDGNKFPYSDAAFDSVLCNQVLEHVFNPDEFLHEISRVMKDGGKLLLTVPFVWDEHEQPYDYARYSSFGLRYLLEKHGFIILQQRKLGADASIIFQLINAYLFRIAQTTPRAVKLLFIRPLMALFNLIGIMLSKLLPGNPDLYLDQVVLAEKGTRCSTKTNKY